jgi:hypothetical protein
VLLIGNCHLILDTIRESLFFRARIVCLVFYFDRNLRGKSLEEFMSKQYSKKFLLFLALFAVMMITGAVIVSADQTGRGELKNKPCYDYDRPSGDTRNVDETQIRAASDCPDNVPTPEPVSIILFSAGLAGVGFAARISTR